MLGMLVLAGFGQTPSANAQSQRALNLMPWPSSVQQGSGELRIDASFSVALTGYNEARLDRSISRFFQELGKETAIPFSSTKPASGGKATLAIHTDHASKEIQELGEDENYALEITPDGAQS